MIRKTQSADEIQRIEIHGHDAWLHTSIAQVTDSEGQPMWTADEVVVRGIDGYDASAIEADFDAFWRIGERDGMTDTQRVDELEQAHAQMAKDQADMAQAQKQAVESVHALEQSQVSTDKSIEGIQQTQIETDQAICELYEMMIGGM